MAQSMRKLLSRCFDTGALYGLSKRLNYIFKGLISKIFKQLTYAFFYVFYTKSE